MVDFSLTKGCELKNQRGQALVEYGILLFVFVLLLVGGAELGMAALSSSKNTDAAKSAANEYADIVEKKNAVKSEINLLLIDLSMLNCNYVNEDGMCQKDDSGATNYFEYLDYVYKNSDDGQEFIADEKGSLQSVVSANANTESVKQAQKQLELLDKFDEYTQYNPRIADHTQITDMPNCDGGTYNYELPTARYAPPVSLGASNIPAQKGDFYFFIPTPIDITNCVGVDEERGGRSRADILIYGYMPTQEQVDAGEFEELFVQGLPQANQAAYSLYERVCLDGGQAYISCQSDDANQVLLKPPGKICLAEDEIGVDSCEGIQPNVAGFYYFGNPNDADLKSFEYVQNEPPVFRSTFQLVCNDDYKIESVQDDVCDDAESIRIHTRYRRVFDGFLTLGTMTVTDPSIVNYFYNPSQVGIKDNVLVAGYGSEVGVVGKVQDGIAYPSIKHMRDFRACYDVSTKTGAVSACN